MYGISQAVVKKISIPIICFIIGICTGMAEQEQSTTLSPNLSLNQVATEVPQTITLDYNTYKTLKQNSNEALDILKASTLTLTEAQKSMVEQEKLLAELKESNDLQAQELKKAKETSTKQLESLKRTEESLNQSIKDYKTLQHKYNVKKRQNKTIAILSVLAIGGVAYVASK